MVRTSVSVRALVCMGVVALAQDAGAADRSSSTAASGGSDGGAEQAQVVAQNSPSPRGTARVGPSVTAGQATPGATEEAAPPGTAMDDIIVRAQRTPASVARQAQKEAPNLINVQTYEEIRKLPDITTAEAVRRIPGLSLETDEGEGRYVNIRGFDADLNSTTFGGLRLPPTNNASPYGGYRAVTLDSIPIGLVGAITVTKSNRPDMDAEALGGTIEITPKTAPRAGDRPYFIQGNLGSGLETQKNTGILDGSVTTGGHYGPFSIVLSGTYYEDRRSIYDVEPAYFNDGAHPYSAINNLQQRDYQLNRKRHAFGIDLGYQPDDDNRWYVRAFDAGYVESYKRPFTNLNFDGNTTVNADGSIQDTLQGASAIQKSFRDENEESVDRIVTAGGRNVWHENILTYDVGYTQGTYHKPFDYNSTYTLTPPAGNAIINYNNAGAGRTPLYAISGVNYLDPSQFVLSGLNNSIADNFDQEYSGAANVEHPIHWTGADTESVKAGFSARIRHKQTFAQPYSYDNLTPLPLSAISDKINPSYYNGQYLNGTDPLAGGVQSVFGSGQIAAADVIANQQQFLNAKENVYAGYVQYIGDFGPLGVLTGVRVEQTNDKTQANGTLTDASGNQTIFPVSATRQYTNVFPSLQLKYEIAPNFLVRAAYSSTIARPGFNQQTTALTVDLGAGLVSQGNPNLKPATADSFDLSFEKYLDNAGIASIGFFDKEIQNYIVSNTLSNQTLANNGLFPGNASGLRIVSYANAGPSYARGIELNYDQRFRNLPGIFSGLGAGANYTYVDSSFEIRPGESSPLPSTSQNTANISVFYERNGLALRLAAYYVSADLFAIGSDKTSDVFNAERTFLDFGGSYAWDANLAVYFNAKNLLDTPHAFFQGTSNRPIQREYYGPTFLAGLRFDY